jgi:hypothetical protein
MFTIDTADFDAGLERLEDKMERVSKIGDDMTPLWPKVGEVFAEQQRQLFASGSIWPALDADTVRIKGSTTILRNTGVLEAAATSPTPVEATALYAKFGVRSGDVPYAHWHSRGAGVPMRKPVPPLSAEMRRAWMQVVIDRVQRELAS